MDTSLWLLWVHTQWLSVPEGLSAPAASRLAPMSSRGCLDILHEEQAPLVKLQGLRAWL